MLRTRVFVVGALLVAGLHAASAQTAAPAATEAKPGKVKLTMQKLKEMKANADAGTASIVVAMITCTERILRSLKLGLKTRTSLGSTGRLRG